MSTERSNPPVDTVRDGQTFIKIWRNRLPSGDPIYSSTIGYTYTDKQTGKPRDSYSLRDSDLLKLPDLSSRARTSIRHFREADRNPEQTGSPSQGPQQSQRPYQGGSGSPQQGQPEHGSFRQSRQQPPAQAQSYSREP